jgi:hypothetical protein
VFELIAKTDNFAVLLVKICEGAFAVIDRDFMAYNDEDKQEIKEIIQNWTANPEGANPIHCSTTTRVVGFNVPPSSGNSPTLRVPR